MADFLEFMKIALPAYYEGALVTFQIAGVALISGFIIGLPIALLRVYGRGVIRWLAVAYIELMRGVPLLVFLFVVYYGLPDMGLTLSAIMSAYLALGLNSGAYQAEYFRGSIQAVGRGQMLGARAIGMTRLQAIWHIIVPQALRLAIPAWTNEAVSMVKYTSVVYLIAVPDLLTRSKWLASKYFNPIEAYLSVAIVYIVIVGILTVLVNYIERRLRIPGLELEKRGH
ncbi:MAG: amino acid ABC transporter permease [Anaerolineales bacterium]|nr:amino acid ABC transporter permease [Anaerolineales bacterium]